MPQSQAKGYWSNVPFRQMTYVAAKFSQTMRMLRVTWPLLSQYVCFLAIKGSSIAGCICPAVLIAREVTVCSPGEGFAQSRDQIFQACSASSTSA